MTEGQAIQAAPAPTEPVALTDKQQYQQITGFLGQLINQFTFPETKITGTRIEALFNDLRSFVEQRLTQEIQKGQ